MNFAIPADPRVKLKESKKKDEYLNLVRRLKKKTKTWNMKLTTTPIVISALSIVTEGLIQGEEDLEIRGRVEKTETTALLRSARILRRVLDTSEDLLSFKLQ